MDERIRKKMYELRQTWCDVFPKSRLFHLDTLVKEIDPAWPIVSQQSVSQSKTIHVNPKFQVCMFFKFHIVDKFIIIRRRYW